MACAGATPGSAELAPLAVGSFFNRARANTPRHYVAQEDRYDTSLLQPALMSDPRSPAVRSQDGGHCIVLLGALLAVEASLVGLREVRSMIEIGNPPPRRPNTVERETSSVLGVVGTDRSTPGAL